MSVALRKESVDRNVLLALKMMKNTESLSARRAWIEITEVGRSNQPIIVALRKESVDRNKLQHSIDMISQRRSPQGERG